MLALGSDWPLLHKRRIPVRDIAGGLATIRRLVLQHGGETLSEW